VLALRADYYDRPLADAGFAPAFLAGVVNDVPMTAAELEAAIVGPAGRVGAEFDPALLAELISDAAHGPGTLPHLQHVLAALFEERTNGAPGLDAYRALGGLRGALTRRAERVFEALDEAGRFAARQVFLRLVRLGAGQRDSGRRATIGELTALDIDPVVLSDTLRAFEAGRLLTFDRDPASGDATVEVAHEALFAEWDRLAGWVAEHRLDLRLHAWLATRVDEWQAGGRLPEDLLAGGRLDEYLGWRSGSSFPLTADERAFLDAGLDRRRDEQASDLAREARERGIERTARLRLVGLVGVAVALVAAVAWTMLAWPGAAPDIVLVYPGADRGGMYDSIAAGFDSAVARHGLDAQTVVQDREGLEARLRRLADQGVGLIVVGHAWSNPEVELVARDHPGTRFLAVDYWGDLPNVAVARLQVNEGTFLVGAAAALRSETGKVGIVVDAYSNLDWPYPAGFWAGARTVDPDVEVLITYLDLAPGTDPRFESGRTPITVITVGRAARELYRSGADVVFYAGNTAPIGVFEAADAESGASGRHVWAIARDADWNLVLPFYAADSQTDVAAWRANVLTSLIARWDVAISTMLDDYAEGELRTGPRRFGLAEGGFELSRSGGHIDDIVTRLESLGRQVASGEITVPEDPPDGGPPH
jgi:basic membrane lipoprotein Med (substrate-binding protein (PBP1-ABC) superfamily)